MLKTDEEKREIQKLNKLGDKITKFVLSTLSGKNILCKLGWHKQVYTHSKGHYWASVCHRCGYCEDVFHHTLFGIGGKVDFQYENNLTYLEWKANDTNRNTQY